MKRGTTISTLATLDALSRRFGVLRTWGSISRVAAWTVVWCAVASAIVAPRLPAYIDRDHEADVPASGVRYVAPISRTDFAGFLPPSDDPDEFTLAWIGGSEVKLREVSLAGAFDQRIDTVGGRRLAIDAYTLIAARSIDAIRAIDTAAAAGADAIAVALNPAWTRAEWGVRGWPNLDVSNLGTLWKRRSTWSWALALTSPDDYVWRAVRAAFPLVEVQARFNARARREVARLNVLDDRSDPSPTDAIGDPRLPPGSAMWLVDEHGVDVLANEDTRVAALIGGIGVSRHEAEFLAGLLIDAADDAGVPVFLYVTPFAPESLADPAFDAAARQVEAFWARLQPTIESPLVELESRSLSRDHASRGTFLNNVHMADPAWFADVLVERLCAQWEAADPAWRCA